MGMPISNGEIRFLQEHCDEFSLLENLSIRNYKIYCVGSISSIFDILLLNKWLC